ncbi:glycoside hydrolase family 99-like domain-containing protein [Parabacteroides sp. PF5-6]|uniref:glycosyltransferase WbsX family protein n=1 Tax=Parabacteroides sp. PF5-6 TaxID=1742403 RepID=UPI002404CAC0|nr:glycoside hydrolase family 99-like domain-containing protein [Parabacteroides sp. PF5-6]MDF9828983.1 hypothetical protein [Parabacteroides sp. PF5-6]
MKKSIKKLVMLSFASGLFLCFSGCSSQVNKPEKAPSDTYYVAAYVWPSCHDAPMNREILWPEGIGEWEIIQKGNPRFEGHYQPKLPLWGYEMDNDPKVMERWIDAATDHGVNLFIFDWYWYDEGPFLESCINDGFLKASNNEKMQFYLMWANHDVKRNYWNVHQYKDDETILWDAKVDWKNFQAIVERVIRQYFHQPNYFKIDGQPVFSIFSIYKLLESFDNNVAETRKALDYFREETKKAGFPDLHIQVIAFGEPNQTLANHIRDLGISSATQYNWGGPHPEDYMQWANESMQRIEKWDEQLSVPFFTNASIGWDDSPRFPHKTAKDIVHHNNTPQSFATFLQKSKAYCDARPDQPKLITLFSWNEWVEGGYLLPDMKYGFGYLEAVRDVMDGRYEKY